MDLKFDNIASEHLIIVVVGYVIVFLSLFLLWVVFYNLPKLLRFRISTFRNFFQRAQKPENTGTPVHTDESVITGEETAAISAALFLFVGELHDTEHTVLTIHKISRRYSPWNSKIYNVTNGLNKRF